MEKKEGSEDVRRYKERERAERTMDYITVDQAKKISEEVTWEKLSTLFRNLGLDISNFAELKKFYEDFDYLRKSREANTERKGVFSKSIITAVVGTILGIVTSIATYFISHVR